MMEIPAGRWSDITWDLNQELPPTAPGPHEPARRLEVCSSNPDHPCCYTGPHACATKLAAGYAAALAVHDTEAIDEPFWTQEAQPLRNGIPAS